VSAATDRQPRREPIPPLASRRDIARAQVESPDGEIHMCLKCGYLAGVPREHNALGSIRCIGGADEFALAEVPPARGAEARR
jgi:hypothetical protein